MTVTKVAVPDPISDASEHPDLSARYRVGDLASPVARCRLRQSLATDGLALFSGLHGKERMLDVAAQFMEIVGHPDGNADGLTVLEDLGPAGDAPNGAGFSSRELLPHTDRSGTDEPPELLMTSCLRPGSRGGAAILVDGKAVHDDLARSSPGAVEALLRPGTAFFGGDGGIRTSVFSDLTSTTRSAAGPVRRQIRLRLDDLALFTCDAAGHVSELRAALRRHARLVPLKSGEGYVLDNHRWLHGRTAFEGPRVLFRLHGRPVASLGLRPGIPLD